MPQQQYTYEQLQAMWDEDPQQAEQQEDTEGAPGDPGGPLARLWSTVSGFSPTRAGKAAVVGAKKAYNQVVDLATGVGQAEANLVSKVPGLSGVGQAYHRAVETSKEDWKFSVEENRDSGVYGFVEGATQFGVGMVAAGEVLKPLKLAGAAAGAAEGFLADFAVMDPHEKRLSNLIADGPEWFGRPVAEFLSAHEDDPEIVARLKTATEGLLTGVAFERTLAGLKYVKARALARSGKISAEEAGKRIEAAVAEARAAKSTDPVEVIHQTGEPSVIRVRQESLFDEATMRELTEGGKVLDNTTVEVADPALAESMGANMNAILKEAQTAPGLSDEQRASIQSVLEWAREKGKTLHRDFPAIAEKLQINLSHVEDLDEVKNVITALGNLARHEAEALANRASDGNGQSWQETLKLADGWIKGVDGETMVKRIAVLFKDTKDLPQKIVGTRIFLFAKARHVADLSKKLAEMPDDPFLESRLAKGIDQLWELHNWLAGTSANVARTLNAHQIPVNGEKAAEALTAAAKGAVDMVESKAPSQMLSKRGLKGLGRMIEHSDGDPSRIFRSIRVAQQAAAEPKNTGVWAKALSWRANLMLSGPKTQIINFVNNAVTAFQIPAEYWWAGKRYNHPELQQQGWDMMVGGAKFLLESATATTKALLHRNTEYLNDGSSAAWRAFKQGVNTLDPGHDQIEHLGYVHPKLGWLSKLVQAPGRALMSGDEFFKQMNYRSYVYAKSLRLSREDGITDAAKVAERLAEDMEASFTNGGAGIVPDALDHAEYSTFSNDLEYGIGKWLQEGATEHPFIRLVFPFVRTPVNIVRFAWERTPGLNRAHRGYRQAIESGGERAAIAKARRDAGAALYSMAGLLAVGKMITGAGPKDPVLRAQWLAAGNQPYSIRVGDRTISYRRIEPLATPFSIIADAAEVFGELDERDAEGIVTAAVAGMMSSLSSKTFLLGMTQTFDAIASGEGWKVDRLLTDLALSFTIPNLVRQTNGDPVWRETRGLVDEARSRVWWASEGLEPKRNLFGEPMMKAPNYFNRTVNPFTSMKAPDDEDEAVQLVKLGKHLSLPAETMLDGKIDLTDRESYDNGTGRSPYDYMMGWMAKPTTGVPPLREALHRLMKSDAWKNANDGTDVHPGGLRWEMANRLISDYQHAAQQATMVEYPKLRQSVFSERKAKATSLFDQLTEETPR